MVVQLLMQQKLVATENLMTKKLSFKEMESNVNIENRLRQEHDQWYIDITDIAIEMFGDIVDKVEITDFYDYTKEEAIEGAKALIEEWKINLKKHRITFDGENMLVTFKNGKKIEIWNSEWGGIRFSKDNEF